MGRCNAGRLFRSAVPLVAVGCGLILALSGCSAAHGTAAAKAARLGPGRPYTLLQMNLCLSGLGSCYPLVDYPAVLQEAITRATGSDANARPYRGGYQITIDRHGAETLVRLLEVKGGQP